MPAPRPRIGRKLLVASIGVATMSYVACGGDTQPSPVGNLMANPNDASEDVPDVGFGDQVVGNLVAPPDARGDAIDESAVVDSPVGNLVAPPTDAGDGG